MGSARRFVIAACVTAVLCATAAMARYPGGTSLDREASGYSLSQNFLSDLGRTVAYDGRPNSAGAVLFVGFVMGLMAGLAAFLWHAWNQYRRSPARLWAQGALVAGALVVAAFVGVAATPDDAFRAVHNQFAHWGFRILPLMPAFLAAAAKRDERLPRLSFVLWAALALLLAAYVGVFELGPRANTAYGLTVQTVWQKVATGSALLVLVVQSFLGSRTRTMNPTRL